MKAMIANDDDRTAEALTIADLPKPHLSEGDVLVRVRAAGFTRTELGWPGTWTDRSGRRRPTPVLGHEMAGEVVAHGFGTSRLAVGQRVVGLTDWTRDGTVAEFVAVEARDLAPLPPDVDDVTAAALPISGLSAWQALFVHSSISSGQRVLIHGCAGAVGTLAVQLAARAGAIVIGTGRAADRESALAAGVTEYVEIGTDGAVALASVRPVEVALDVLGGEMREATVPLIEPGGTLVSIVGLPSEPVQNGRAVHFVVEPDRAMLAHLVAEVRAGRLTPRVDAVCGLSDAPTAFSARGRTIIRTDDQPT